MIDTAARRTLRTAAFLLAGAVPFAIVPTTSAAIPRSSPHAAPDARSCGCAEDFERLIVLTEANYIGFPLLVRGDTRRLDYDANVERLRRRAALAIGDACVLLLRAFTDWFGDGHLFISEQPSLDADSTAALLRTAPYDPRGEAELMGYFAARGDALDPIEGIWFTKDGARYAIVQRNDAAGEFVAITLRDPAAAWSAGHIKAWFTSADADVYDVNLLAADRTSRRFVAVIRRDMLLHMAPLTWGREYPSRGDDALLHPDDPRAPIMRTIRNGVLLLSIPSHAPEYRPRLDSLIALHHDALFAAELLIIDLRGNEGGSSLTTSALIPYLATREERPRLGPEPRMTVLTSDENIRFFAAMGVPESLLEKMRAANGKMLMIQPEYDALTGRAGQASRDHIRETAPRHVAIVTDRGTVSAAEAFVVDAARSTKVTILGENSGGVIDLQNVRLVPLACGQRGLMLGYPTIAASDRLPDGGLNASGIPVHLPLNVRSADIAAPVLRHYSARPY